MLNAKTFGDGPALVILHGLFGMLDNWQTLARKWAKTHHVVLLDLRNHGRSFHTDEMNYAVMAEDVAATLEDMGIDECELLGHSMGGKVAMQTALTYPELVKKLVVVDIVPRRYHPGHNAVFAALSTLDPATITDRKAAAEKMSVHLADPGVQLFLLKNLARNPAGGFRWRMNLPAISASYDQLIGPVGQLGDEYDGPALFIRGANSGYVQDEDLELIQILFPKATLETVAKAGHWVHAEQPEALLAVVDSFLATK
jgi:pimeloyl-ACP methyl ester carboxylesterase